MSTSSLLGRSALHLLSASLLLGGAACANNKPASPPVEAPVVITSAEVKPTPIVIVSPNLSVASDVAAACKLRFDDTTTAPKFDFDRSVLAAQDGDVLAQIAACVTTGPLSGRALDLVGRADPRGESEYNMALGERRANSVRAYLSGLGVSGANLIESSRGKLDATGTDEIGWQRDRRVDIRLH